MGKMSAKAMAKIELLEECRRKTERIASQTAQYAGARTGHDQFLMNIIRSASTMQRNLMTNGFGTMADSANQIVMLARRGGTPNTKSRNLKEHIASLHAAIDRAAKAVKHAEREAHAAG